MTNDDRYERYQRQILLDIEHLKALIKSVEDLRQEKEQPGFVFPPEIQELDGLIHEYVALVTGWSWGELGEACHAWMMRQERQRDCKQCDWISPDLIKDVDPALNFCKVCGRQLRDVPQEPAARFRVCGCTDEMACPGGCYWVAPDLCSRCEGYLNPEKQDDEASLAQGLLEDGDG